MRAFGSTRRAFLKTSLLGGVAGWAAASLRGFAASAPAPGAVASTSRVALSAGADRADNIFRGLKTFEREIARAIGNRRVVLKPNNVAIDVPLCATHVDCLEATLE